jgi:outer membrane protein OmpA-like peptidoglycan-associated protein
LFKKSLSLVVAVALAAPFGFASPSVSADGTTWTSRTAPEANRWQGVAYGNGTFVAVASDGTNRVMTSPDGITCTARGSTTDSSDMITYGGGKFVAIGPGPTNKVMTSTDGITWTPQTIPSNISSWRSVAWGNNTFVAVSMTGAGTTNRIMTSPDGVTWTLGTSPHSGNWNSVTFGNGTFVAVSSHQAAAPNTLASSSDGITWAAHSASDTSSWSAVTYGDGIYVAVAANGSGARIMTSGTLTPPTTTTTTTVAPTTTTTVPPAPVAPAAVPGVTVTDTKIYARPPARVAASSAITMLTRAQNRTSDIITKTPAVCLPNDDELVFIDTGRCIAEVVNTKTRKVLRTLKTSVIDDDDVSEMNVGNEIVTLAPIYFENGSSTVDAKARATLRRLKSRISAAGSVLVVGHSGTLNGNTPDNQALSRQRALSTVAALRAIKAQGPFSVAGVGALDPARTGRTDAAQARNRRVVMVLIP